MTPNKFVAVRATPFATRLVDRASIAENSQPWNPLPGHAKLRCITCGLFYSHPLGSQQIECRDCKRRRNAQRRQRRQR